MREDKENIRVTGKLSLGPNATLIMESGSRTENQGTSAVGFSRGTLAALGSSASDAAVITKQITVVTASNGTKGVALPAAGSSVGPYWVINSVATTGATLPVYPINGGNDNINAGAEDAAFTVGPGKIVMFIPVSATQWYAEDVSSGITTTSELNWLAGLTAGTVTASKAVVVNATKDVGDFRNLDVVNLDAGVSGTAGSVDIFPATASKGKLAITVTDQTGDTTVSLVAGAMGAARTITLRDPGAAASILTTTDATAAATTATAVEISQIAGLTAGAVTASKAVIVDANKDIGDFRNLDAVNIDAGASGTAGSVDVFPATASRGKLSLACTDQTGDTAVTINVNAMGQATQVNLPDPGAAASYLMQSTAQITLAEADVLDGATAGTIVNSKAVIAGAAGNIGIAKITELHIGASGAETQVNATGAEINQACDQSTQVLTPGAGITAGVGTVYKSSIAKQGDIFKTTIFLDLTGLASTTTADDIIGTAGVCHLGQITAAKNGTLFYGQVTCLETPAGGDLDIDFWSATESTGAYDALVTDLTEVIMRANGGNWAAGAATQVAFTNVPAADKYMYAAVGSAGGAPGTYTAGQFLIELFGA